MKLSSNGLYSILFILLVFILFVVYRYGFSKRFYNIYSKTTTLDLSQSNQTYLIEKHTNQKEIYRLELTFKGKLSDNIALSFSDGKQSVPTEIKLKHGTLDASFLLSWNADKAYISIQNPDASSNKIELEYQFISK